MNGKFSSMKERTSECVCVCSASCTCFLIGNSINVINFHYIPLFHLCNSCRALDMNENVQILLHSYAVLHRRLQSFPVHTSRNASKLAEVGGSRYVRMQCMLDMHMSMWSKWGSKYSLADVPVLVAFIHLIMKVRLAQGQRARGCHSKVNKRFTH